MANTNAQSYGAGNAQAWKNLGAAYYNLDKHDEELHCYDRALALDSELMEAVSSKGITLIAVFKKFGEGVGLLERAIGIAGATVARWPQLWYWMAVGYRGLGDLRTAPSRDDGKSREGRDVMGVGLGGSSGWIRRRQCRSGLKMDARVSLTLRSCAALKDSA